MVPINPAKETWTIIKDSGNRKDLERFASVFSLSEFRAEALSRAAQSGSYGGATSLNPMPVNANGPAPDGLKQLPAVATGIGRAADRSASAISDRRPNSGVGQQSRIRFTLRVDEGWRKVGDVSMKLDKVDSSGGYTISVVSDGKAQKKKTKFFFLDFEVGTSRYHLQAEFVGSDQIAGVLSNETP